MFNLSEMPDAARRRQNATFRDPENTRGLEYCPCTIVLSFDNRCTVFDKFSTLN